MRRKGKIANTSQPTRKKKEIGKKRKKIPDDVISGDVTAIFLWQIVVCCVVLCGAFPFLSSSSLFGHSDLILRIIVADG